MAVAPPRPKGLPLNALRAFEAAARLGGFAAAAGELGVTAGAVAAQVKGLEDLLGAPLFDRHSRGVRLSPLGRDVLPDLSAAFDALGLAAHALRGSAAPRRVHIATLPAVAQLWLSPRLPVLRAEAPDLAISITALEGPPELKRTPYDLCLFYSEDGGGMTLAEDEIFPVCAPSVAAGLARPEDLAEVPCLGDSTWSEDWRLWAETAMPHARFVPTGPVYSLYALALAEAVNGAGVLIGHSALVEAALRCGDLVAPFTQRVRLPRRLSLWSARPLRPDTPAGRVAAWLSR